MTDSSDICFGSFLVIIDKRNYYLIWITRTDSLPCNFSVFIFKLSECKQVDFYANCFAVFFPFLVSINDTDQLDFRLYFIFIGTTS